MSHQCSASSCCSARSLEPLHRQCDLCRAAVDVDQLIAKLTALSKANTMSSDWAGQRLEEEETKREPIYVGDTNGRDVFVGPDVEADSSWPGNKFFLEMVDTYHLEYAAAGCKHEKTALLQAIEEKMKEEGRRFLQWDPDARCCEELTPKEARLEVESALLVFNEDPKWTPVQTVTFETKLAEPNEDFIQSQVRKGLDPSSMEVAVFPGPDHFPYYIPDNDFIDALVDDHDFFGESTEFFTYSDRPGLHGMDSYTLRQISDDESEVHSYGAKREDFEYESRTFASQSKLLFCPIFKFLTPWKKR